MPDGSQDFADGGVAPNLRLLAQALRQGPNGTTDSPTAISPDLAALAQALRDGAAGSDNDPSTTPVLQAPTASPSSARTPDYGAMADILGKIWNAPNTLLGLLYGGAGTIAGEAMGTHPRISIGNNAVQFRNNPFIKDGALTLGNTTIWKKDPYSSSDDYWHDANGAPLLEGAHTYPQHERPHTIQGQQLGPLYLPSNLLGGALGLIRDSDWHGPSNWNETGPKSDPPKPWGR
jgi:hypothetical protein